MREVEKNGVTVDICPSCKGVWLDRGELEKLMEYAAASAYLDSPILQAIPKTSVSIAIVTGDMSMMTMIMMTTAN